MTSRRAPWRAGGRTVLEPVDLVWALYARISDAEDEVGVTAQLEELEPFALGHGGRVGEVFPENDTSAFKRRPFRLPDGTTGYRVMRPHWDRMLTGLRSGRFNAVAFVNSDRALRDPRDLEDLIDLVEQYGILVKGMTGSIDLTTDDGIAAARTTAAQRNGESRNTSRRVSAGNRRAAYKGKVLGGIRAYGWRSDRRRVNKREATMIREGRERLLSGVHPRSIAIDWNSRGIKTVKDKKWTANSVQNVLTHPRLCGWRVYRGEVLIDPTTNTPVRGQWDPILTEEEFADIQRVLPAKPATRGTAGGRVAKTLLSGLVRCGKCDAKMRGDRLTLRDGRKYSAYKCPGKGYGGCGGIARRADLVDAHVIALVKADQARRGPVRKKIDVPEWDGKALLKTVQKKMKETSMQYRTDAMSGKTYFPLIQELENDERELLAEQRAHDAKYADLRTASIDFATEWDDPDFTLEQKRSSLALSLVAVRIMPIDRSTHFDPELIVPIWRE